MGNISIGTSFSSRLAYPDPLKPSGIEFDLPEEACVALSLFDIDGHEIAILIDNQTLPAGTHTVDFAARGYSRGEYFYRLSVQANGKKFVDTKRIVVGQ